MGTNGLALAGWQEFTVESGQYGAVERQQSSG